MNIIKRDSQFETIKHDGIIYIRHIRIGSWTDTETNITSLNFGRGLEKTYQELKKKRY